MEGLLRALALTRLPPPSLAHCADTEWKGWVLTGFFFVDAWLLGIALQRMAFGCLRCGIRARAALTTMIARKCYGMAHLTKETVSGWPCGVWAWVWVWLCGPQPWALLHPAVS